MKICLITPAATSSLTGNSVTSTRWSRILRHLGHEVSVWQDYSTGRFDLLVALHALKSWQSIRKFYTENPGCPIVVALTGTDVYDKIHVSAKARESLEMASRLVALQPKALEQLSPGLRRKTVVIYQSLLASKKAVKRLKTCFEVCVIANLRSVKDPLRTAYAARLLPASSKIKISHIGAALDNSFASRATKEQSENHRYSWLGEMPRWKTQNILRRSRLLVLTSKMEGGANVVSEAIVSSVPVISTRISGSIGMLGEKYPGYFPYGDTKSLAKLLYRAECDKDFYNELTLLCKNKRKLFRPANEVKAWRELLDSIQGD
ncbi:MAG: TIGR04348 family glycosyltransferase [candidate division Zixibacteria bacterium]|nr:TIGR04348 family glycosyltransferase [candidate division Zixibacteria bacterium]